MKHERIAAASGIAPAHRCRLCTTNDRDALVEQLAARLWESRVDDGVTRTWETVPPHWRMVFLDHAGVAVGVLEGA